MNTQHTKSPWTALPTGANGGAMAFGPDFAPLPQTWENARLIAAAPDLLDIVDTLVGLACDRELRFKENDPVLLALADRARAAIARATGAS